ncbi:uncharacterized protein [Macrobrachium rosenbergii]|uniref:uncharacterized protein isoform X2 n=1 Tax=Macrobrachium rosenbergii TaxID=79674 RepID=UPI0034D69F75
MNWLWIPAVVLVSLFVVVLCWLFFKDYTCCPCRRKSQEPVLPTHHTSSFLPPDEYQPSAPPQCPITPRGSPHLQLTHADLPVRAQGSVLPTACDANAFSFSASLPPTQVTSKLSSKPHSIQQTIRFSSEGAEKATPEGQFQGETKIYVPPSKAAVPKQQPLYTPQDDTLTRRITRKPPIGKARKSASQYYPKSAGGSLHLHLKHADNLSLRKVFTYEGGNIPTLDLHKMTVKEAVPLVTGFIDSCRYEEPKIRIITGRGVHSKDGIPRLKPAIIRIIERYGLEYREIYSGGCLEISFD